MEAGRGLEEVGKAVAATGLEETMRAVATRGLGEETETDLGKQFSWIMFLGQEARTVHLVEEMAKEGVEAKAEALAVQEEAEDWFPLLEADLTQVALELEVKILDNQI